MTTATFEQNEKQRRLASYQNRKKNDCLPLTPAQQQLMADNYKLVYGYIRRKMRYVRSDRDELASHLFQFLLRAVQMFDPNRDVKFSTYADQWFNAGRSKWHYEEMRESRIPVCHIGEVVREECDGIYFGLPDEKTLRPNDEAEVKDTLLRCRKYVPDPRRWAILEWRHRDGLSLAQIGQRVRLSKERVRQVIADTLHSISLRSARAEMGQRELFKEREEEEEQPTQYLGRCPHCGRLIRWCGQSTLPAEAEGLLAEVLTAGHLRERDWGHGAGCSRRKKKRRREEKTMFEASEN